MLCREYWLAPRAAAPVVEMAAQNAPRLETTGRPSLSMVRRPISSAEWLTSMGLVAEGGDGVAEAGEVCDALLPDPHGREGDCGHGSIGRGPAGLRLLGLGQATQMFRTCQPMKRNCRSTMAATTTSIVLRRSAKNSA